MKLELAAALVAAGLVLAPVAGYAADAKGGPTTIEKGKEIIDDATITTKIKAEYAKDKAVSAMNIKVDTDKGVVKLSGNAKSKAEAEKAAAIAKGTAGVARVQNDIQVSKK